MLSRTGHGHLKIKNFINHEVKNTETFDFARKHGLVDVSKSDMRNLS